MSNRHEQVGSFSREMETVGKNQLEMIEINNMVTEVNNDPDGLTSNSMQP